ncbi:MAG: gamma carbonic anhydrase family protein [Eggerthellaceae bacterium]|nr:gamma carbonic anhydrase family protein [Eggerthellaceae bacterium]
MGASISDYHLVKMDESACLSPYASICGDVSIGAETSVFAGTQIRGDCEPIVVGERTNIQENSCLHVSAGSKLTVGNHVTVGHMAMLHGCTIDDNVLVGMGSIVMDDAHISSDCVIAAGSLVTQGKEFPPRSLIMGQPARLVRELTDEEVEAMVTVAADAYYEVAKAMVADGLMEHPTAESSIWPS